MESKNNILDVPTHSPWFTKDGHKIFGRKNAKDELDGPCRMIDREGNVIEGIFKDGVGNVTLYKAYQNYITGEWK